MPITLLVARRIQCSYNHDKSPRIDLDKANRVFGWFWPYSKPTFAFFYYHPLPFCQHIDNVISASYGPDLNIIHKCIGGNENDQLKVDIPDNLFSEKDPTILRRARHKDLYDEVKGGIMFCPDCEQTVSSIDIVNKALQRWKDCLIPGDRAQHNRPDTMIPLSKERLDMAAYTFSYHMNGGCFTETDPFWGNNSVRETLLRYRFEEHSFSHSASCFKKDCECRFFFDKLAEVFGDINKSL